MPLFLWYHHPPFPTSSSLDPVASRLPPPSGMIHSPNAPPHQPSLSLPQSREALVLRCRSGYWMVHHDTASRSTRDASGTPATSASSGHKRKASVENSKDKKKKKAGKKAGLVRSKAADPKQAASSGRSSVGGVTEEDESMVKFGGLAIDDDVDEQIERRNLPRGKRGLPQNASPSHHQIAPAAPRPLTKKEQRNNAKKWSLPHLLVIPLPNSRGSDSPGARITWYSPALGSVDREASQEIVDKVYGAGKHIVLFDGPWFGLVAYRASDWRSGFGIQALKGIQALINCIRPAKFTFDTPEGIAAFVAWALQNTRRRALWPFIGRRGVMGLLQSHLIMYTFAHHLSALKTIPDLHKHLEAEPSGAFSVGTGCMLSLLLRVPF
ncbi:hypothetical protein B0H10DRAFT_2223864 [Mycena sp. CBHHK59/15]|nr:hypothetical protein B0H10DRAFT_2223864 [Mycena sp. CBHHK59/15]